MKNTVTKKILASVMLMTFAFSSTLVTASAAGIGDYLSGNINGTLLAQELNEIRGLNSSAATSSVVTGVTSGASKINDAGKPTETIKLRAETSLTKLNKPVTLSLRDSDIKQVLRMFADKAGLNIIFENGVSGNITMDLVDVPLNSAFEMVMEMNQLYFIVDNNTLIVYSDPSRTTINMKELIPIQMKYVDAQPMANFLNTNIFGLKKPGLSGSIVATTNPRKNEVLIFGTQNDAAMAKKVIEQFDTKPVFKTYKVNHVTPDVMANMLCTQLLPTLMEIGGSRSSSVGQVTGAAADSGGGKGLTLGGGVVACDYTAGSASGGGKGSVDFAAMPLLTMEVSYSAGLGTVNIMGATSFQFNLIEDFIKKNDRKEPQAYLEVSIIELSETGSKTFDNTWSFMSSNFSASFSDGTTGTNPIFPMFVRGDKVPVFDPTGDPPNEPKYYLSKYSGPPTLTYAINYLVENGKARVVANPRILITNGQESVIDLTSDYVKTVTSQVVQGVQSATAQKDYEIGDDNGIKINMTPFISPDGYVTLNIKPDYSTIKEQIYTVGEDGELTKDLVATLLQRRSLDLKNVRIKDGETLVIGGLLRDDETKSVKKIPVLGDLPYVGALFRSTSTKKTKEEMIIMITPKILTDNEDSVNGQDTL